MDEKFYFAADCEIDASDLCWNPIRRKKKETEKEIKTFVKQEDDKMTFRGSGGNDIHLTITNINTNTNGYQPPNGYEQTGYSQQTASQQPYYPPQQSNGNSFWATAGGTLVGTFGGNLLSRLLFPQQQTGQSVYVENNQIQMVRGGGGFGQQSNNYYGGGGGNGMGTQGPTLYPPTAPTLPRHHFQ